MNERRIAFIQGLRDFADFLEAHPSVDMPIYTTITVFAKDREALARQARAAKWEKEYGGDWFNLRRIFCDDLHFDVSIKRDQVCRKVVVGTKIVEATDEQIIPAKPEHEVPVEEWICEESILKG